MKRHFTCLAMAVAATISATSQGQTTITIYSSASPGSLSPSTFQSGGEGYSVPGYAMVKQEREFQLARGRNVVRLSDVPALIDPTTVAFESLFDPASTRVVEQSFEFDLTSTNKLLQKYLDREVTVEQSRGQAVESVTGTLIGTQGGLVLRMADGTIRTIGSYIGVRLSSLPGGLISKPTLVWDLAAERAGSHRSRVSYQTSGVTWWSDYNLVLSEGAGSCKLDVGAWVTIINQSGASFEDARLKLVAGDVQRARPQPQYAPAAAARMDLAMKAREEGFAEKSFFEYHLYTLGRPATLRNNSAKQIELFPVARSVKCEKTLMYYGQAGQFSGYYGSPMTDRNFGNQSNKKVDVYVRFKNREDNNMGIPLPAGKVRVAKLDAADQSLEFIGEDLLDHTPKNETIKIKLGSAFDVVGERRQADFKFDSTAKTMEEEIEIKLRNQKDETATVIVKENLYRWTNWVVTRKTLEYEKVDARTIHFPVKIAKGGEAVIRYTVRYTW